MEKSRALVSREPQLQEELSQWRNRIAHQEDLLSDSITEYVALEARLDRFHQEEYWPKVGKYQTESKRLWDILMGGVGDDTPVMDEEQGRSPREREEKPEPKSKAALPSVADELKQIYRKLVKLYHPDSAAAPQDKDFCHSRMAAINEAFQQGDLKALQRFLQRSDAEFGGAGKSSLERIESLKLDAMVLEEILLINQRRILELRGSATLRLMEETRLYAKEGVDFLDKLAGRYKDRIEIYKRACARV